MIVINQLSSIITSIVIQTCILVSNRYMAKLDKEELKGLTSSFKKAIENRLKILDLVAYASVLIIGLNLLSLVIPELRLSVSSIIIIQLACTTLEAKHRFLD